MKTNKKIDEMVNVANSLVEEVSFSAVDSATCLTRLARLHNLLKALNLLGLRQ